MGAHVVAADLTPQLLERARENARVAQVEIEWHEADVEQLPFADAQFEIVVSQFAHMFAPRPEVAIREMLRVLRPGGSVAFSTWPPELFVGRTMQLASRYMPPPRPEIVPPSTWGDPQTVTQRLGSAVNDVVFDRDHILVPALSPQHFRANIERAAGPIIKMVQTLSASQPERLEAYRAEFDAIVSQYMRDNLVRQDYLLTRARKV
jgi:SAM-dependent methyltransferase